MVVVKRLSIQWMIPVIVGVSLLTLGVFARPAAAITPLPTPDPQSGAYGLEATKTQPPPTKGASITTPKGGSYNTSPITVNGICPNGLLVQIYNNGVMVGAVVCKGGSFSLKVSLFAGKNELSAIVYDDLDQAGPTSNTVTVTYKEAQLSAFGELITLTSAYGRRSAAAGAKLSWPLQLSGGTGPYAFSIDWGDGSSNELKSQTLAGLVTIAHVYKQAGIAQVNVRVTDVNGVSAFLQTIAVANGKVDDTSKTEPTTGTKTITKILWIPAAVALVLIPAAFWLGRRSQMVSIRNRMLKERDSVKQK